MLRQLVQTDDGTVGDQFSARDDLARLARVEAGAGSGIDVLEADWTLPSRIVPLATMSPPSTAMPT